MKVWDLVKIVSCMVPDMDAEYDILVWNKERTENCHYFHHDNGKPPYPVVSGESNEATSC